MPSRDLIRTFARSGLPVRLEGLVNPQLWVGSYQVQLGMKQLPVLTSSLFEDQLFMKRADNDWNSRLATPLCPFPLRRSGLEKQALEGQFQSLQRRVDAPDGTKFFVISRAFQGYVYDSILTEAKNCMVSLYVTHKDATRVRWVDSWAALTAPGDDNRALVLTLLNQDHLEFLDWDILPPSSIKRQ